MNIVTFNKTKNHFEFTDEYENSFHTEFFELNKAQSYQLAISFITRVENLLEFYKDHSGSAVSILEMAKSYCDYSNPLENKDSRYENYYNEKTAKSFESSNPNFDYLDAFYHRITPIYELCSFVDPKNIFNTYKIQNLNAEVFGKEHKIAVQQLCKKILSDCIESIKNHEKYQQSERENPLHFLHDFERSKESKTNLEAVIDASQTPQSASSIRTLPAGEDVIRRSPSSNPQINPLFRRSSSFEQKVAAIRQKCTIT